MSKELEVEDDDFDPATFLVYDDCEGDTLLEVGITKKPGVMKYVYFNEKQAKKIRKYLKKNLGDK